MRRIIFRTGCLLLGALLLHGCGGSGSGSGDMNARVGTYEGEERIDLDGDVYRGSIVIKIREGGQMVLFDAAGASYTGAWDGDGFDAKGDLVGGECPITIFYDGKFGDNSLSGSIESFDQCRGVSNTGSYSANKTSDDASREVRAPRRIEGVKGGQK